MWNEPPKKCKVNYNTVVNYWVPKGSYKPYFIKKCAKFLNERFLSRELLSSGSCRPFVIFNTNRLERSFLVSKLARDKIMLELIECILG